MRGSTGGYVARDVYSTAGRGRRHTVGQAPDLCLGYFVSDGGGSAGGVGGRLYLADEMELAKMLDFFPFRERHSGGGLSPDEHFATVPGYLLGGIAGVFGQLKALGPVVDSVGRVGIADLNVEDGAHVSVGSGGKRSDDGGGGSSGGAAHDEDGSIHD